MPSGAKKRKAAKRKKQLEEATTAHSNNSSIDERDEDESLTSEGPTNTVSPADPPPGTAPDRMEPSEEVNGGGAVVHAEGESGSSSSEDSSSESDKELKETGDGSGSAEVPVDVVVVEEVEEVMEPAVEAVEASGPPVTAEAVRISEEPSETVGVESREESRSVEEVVTEVVSVPPPVVHRTSWWNCCGLFDVLTGSRR